MERVRSIFPSDQHVDSRCTHGRKVRRYPECRHYSISPQLPFCAKVSQGVRDEPPILKKLEVLDEGDPVHMKKVIDVKDR